MRADALKRFVPALSWLASYDRRTLPADVLAGFITAVLLVPQGMAYATLAGLPPQVGLYASILPPLIYALLGTSRTLSVGPVSVAALLVANALASSSAEAYLADALLLAAMSGVLLLMMALLRLDVLVNFISHPTLSGFTSGAALLIILSQLGNLLAISVPSTGSGLETVYKVATHLPGLDPITATLGAVGIALLLLSRRPFVSLLMRTGASESVAVLTSRAGPLVVISLLTVCVAILQLEQKGVAVVGALPQGLPSPSLDFLRLDRVADLLPAALMISLIGYVESISVAKVLAFRRRQKIDNNQELIALGASNMAAAFAGGMPVAGGFSRSTVNFSAGARTQLAGIVTAVLVALVALFFTPLFYHLPKAALGAIIVVAVASLLDWRGFVNAWRYDKADALTLLVTFGGVLLFDIEMGLLLGVIMGVGVFLWRSSRPHVAVVGRIPGTQHFRNVKRHSVETWPGLLLLRVDRSLFFANISYVDDLVAEQVADNPELKHLVIICSAMNTIDYSALEALEQLADSLHRAGISLHLAEVKGPVMDRLAHFGIEEWLSPGKVFLSAEEAVQTLKPDE
ncbi:SulP family inorganic anion transporter [Marinimicrobium sp. C2-29]|uniref:SulP family inorganic anion transporter n=1 Tax=Marinimicrobium sp. C2-29 TaxID=3139825 RepID=UPI003138B055